MTSFKKWYNHYINIIILISVIIILTESRFDSSITFVLEILFTLTFLMDYIYNIYVNKNRVVKYIFSFLGIVDFLSIYFFPLFKILRLFKFYFFNEFFDMLQKVVKRESESLLTIVASLIILIIFFGYLMYLVEQVPNDSIKTPFDGVYYIFTAVSTAGFGDIVAETNLGRVIMMTALIIGNSIFVIIPMIISVGLYDEIKLRRRGIENEIR